MGKLATPDKVLYTDDNNLENMVSGSIWLPAALLRKSDPDRDDPGGVFLATCHTAQLLHFLETHIKKAWQIPGSP
jgi:hypothetical protein